MNTKFPTEKKRLQTLWNPSTQEWMAYTDMLERTTNLEALVTIGKDPKKIAERIRTNIHYQDHINREHGNIHGVLEEGHTHVQHKGSLYYIKNYIAPTTGSLIALVGAIIVLLTAYNNTLGNESNAPPRQPRFIQ